MGGGIILPAFNEATRKVMFSISFFFLNSSEIFLFMTSFYNILCIMTDGVAFSQAPGRKNPTPRRCNEPPVL